MNPAGPEKEQARNGLKSRLFKKALFQKTAIGFPLSRKGLFKPRAKRPSAGAAKKKICPLGKKGQGLVEYLILVALMGVAAIGIVRTLNQTVKSRFANAIYALQGRNQKAKTHNMKKEEYQRSDLSNFMSGAASSDKKDKKKKRPWKTD